MRLSLTKRGEYAVRMTLLLATMPGRRVTAGELGAACTIPMGNVPTIVNLLSRAGVLDCSPGRGGGCTLGRPPDEISVLEVIEAVEGPLGAVCVLQVRSLVPRDPRRAGCRLLLRPTPEGASPKSAK